MKAIRRRESSASGWLKDGWPDCLILSVPMFADTGVALLLQHVADGDRIPLTPGRGADTALVEVPGDLLAAPTMDQLVGHVAEDRRFILLDRHHVGFVAKRTPAAAGTPL